jgi:hypothetical protein
MLKGSERNTRERKERAEGIKCVKKRKEERSDDTTDKLKYWDRNRGYKRKGEKIRKAERKKQSKELRHTRISR